ncbi:MAG TPA: NUDIX hydrolase [Verrucomicrobiae bacterium]|jgi:ADP-ribose pyrophosphatase|nr:NUDIX hydrolase [Verrucomicrobiae bacterium]
MPPKATSRTTAKVLRSKMIYKGPVFGLRRDDIIEPSGLRVTREVITHPGSVVVLPALPDGRIVLIRQYRHATRQFLWELVAGRIDNGENPRRAAARELIEETGYRAKRFHVFLDIFPTPGFLEERMYILLAEDLTPGEAEPEEDEKIICKAFTHGEIEQMIRRNKIRDAKSVAGILYYLRFLVRS